MADLPTDGWFALQPSIQYRKIALYSLSWPSDVNLSQMNVATAPFGGPIAIVRNPKKIIEVGGATAKPAIRIFTAAGNGLSTIEWNSGSLLTLGWSDAEQLLCVQDDGVVLIYDMFGQYKHTFGMGQEAKDTKVLSAKIFMSNAGTGVAIMTTNHRIFLVNSSKDPRTRQLPEMPKSALNPTCWAVLSEERDTCCLVAREQEIFRLRQGDSVCTMHNVSFTNSFRSIIMMSVSYNHRFVALYTDSGVVWMGTANLQTKLCEFQTNRTERPTQIEWILDMEDHMKYEAIAIAYPSLLLIVSITGHSTEYTYDYVPYLIPENDCVRILSNDTHEMLEKVPKFVNNIFTYNSQQPSGWLYYAHQKYEAKNHESDEVLSMIADKLEDAVDECIEAAGYVFNTTIQKNLIRSAYFGKGFIVGHSPEKYIKMCRILRVLNALRDPEIGIPLTYSQFNQLQPNVILDRLVFRKHYGLAIQIAKHLKLPESRILEHWAFYKVMYDNNDDQVVKKIAEKLRLAGGQGISICNIAKKAGERNRKELAIRLLDLEPKPSLQVPLLLSLGENKRALMSATKSGDTDLIHTVLLQLKGATQLAEFLMMVRTFPVAQNLYKKYCNLNSRATLQDIFNQEDDFVAQAEFALQDGIANSNVESALLTASVAYKKAHKDIEWELCEDARKLMKTQKTFADKYSTSSTQSFHGLSLHQTMKRLLQLGDIKYAEKMKSEYKVSDKRFWWLRIQVLAESFQWEELDKFSKSKKSPIGYEPFVEVCLKKHNVEEAKKYLPKCRNDQKVKWYIRAGLVEEAAQTCFEQRDLQSLYTVHMIAVKSNNRTLVTKIEGLIGKLSEK